jgi:hypothetical protein
MGFGLAPCAYIIHEKDRQINGRRWLADSQNRPSLFPRNSSFKFVQVSCRGRQEPPRDEEDARGGLATMEGQGTPAASPPRRAGGKGRERQCRR